MKFQKQPANLVFSSFFLWNSHEKMVKIKLLELSITQQQPKKKQQIKGGGENVSQISVHSIENLDFIWKIGLEPILAHDKINGVYTEKSSAHETWKIL